MNTKETLAVNENTDSEKRGRIVFFSLLIAISMFVIKMAQSWDQLWISYAIAGVYILVTFLGLIWVFSFQIHLKSIPCLIQSSLFVGSEFLFVEMFFFEKLDRVYEAFLLLGILCIIWIATYVSFLMTNIFNVGLYRSIPLEQVARTASYILSLFMIYFFTFSFLTSGVAVYFLLPAVFICYFSITAMHIRNLELEKKDFWRKSLLVTLIIFILFTGSFLIGTKHEFVSVVPTVGFFVSIGGISESMTGKESKNSFLFYSFLLLIATVINILSNI